MLNKTSAFSLIELMVVIAIVAILAAVAVPAYKEFTIKAKLESVMPVIDHMRAKSIGYYEKHGDFGNVTQIGIPGYPSQPDRTNTEFPPNSISDYYLQPYLMTVIMGAAYGYTCDGSITLSYLSNLNDGVYTASNTNVDIAAIQIATIHKDNTFSSYCMYSYGNGNQPTGYSGNYLPNCVNSADNPSAFSDLTAFLNSC